MFVYDVETASRESERWKRQVVNMDRLLASG
jgi:hypothetical protein